MLDGLAEGCAVVDGAAHVVCACVTVGVDVDHADGARVTGERSEDWGADGMVAADGEGGDVGGCEGVVKGFDLTESGFEIVGAFNPAVAEVSDTGLIEGGGAGGVVIGAEEGGLVANFPGSVAGTGAVGDAAVEGNADNANVAFGEVLGVRGAEEGWDTGVAGLGLRVVELGVIKGGF